MVRERSNQRSVGPLRFDTSPRRLGHGSQRVVSVTVIRRSRCPNRDGEARGVRVAFLGKKVRAHGGAEPLANGTGIESARCGQNDNDAIGAIAAYHVGVAQIPARDFGDFFRDVVDVITAVAFREPRTVVQGNDEHGYRSLRFGLSEGGASGAKKLVVKEARSGQRLVGNRVYSRRGIAHRTVGRDCMPRKAELDVA